MDPKQRGSRGRPRSARCDLTELGELRQDGRAERLPDYIRHLHQIERDYSVSEHRRPRWGRAGMTENRGHPTPPLMVLPTTTRFPADPAISQSHPALPQPDGDPRSSAHFGPPDAEAGGLQPSYTFPVVAGHEERSLCGVRRRVSPERGNPRPTERQTRRMATPTPARRHLALCTAVTLA